MCVICLVDCHVNAVISYHILCLFFPQKWRQSQRRVVKGWFHGQNACWATAPRGRSQHPACPPSAPQPCYYYCCWCWCCCTGRHTCYTFPGVWRWRGHKHPAAQRAHTHTHPTHTIKAATAAAHTACTIGHEAFIQLLSFPPHTTTHSNTTRGSEPPPPTTHTHSRFFFL